MLVSFYGALFIACLPYTEGQSYHEYGLIESCSGSAGSNEILFTYDTEVAAYMDLEDAKIVLLVPDVVYGIAGFDTLPLDINFNPIDVRLLCKDAYSRTLSLNISEPPLESPYTSIYPRNEVKLNVNNTLICLVSGFFPPPVKVSWTKNNVNVTDGSTVSRYYPNKDGTLNVFSRLSFIPEEGDIYSCSVEHKALPQPQTRTWDITEPSIGPSVFCGVGLALGLLGLVTGVFFIAKEKKWI
ncbi:H-2 class II histocompatibility antigen, I-E alpha chain [Rhinichthys klamathensis goyatoka]|uniref:H-2 class II histocompatibility antigen, I-E alpha chain n=1 Tax=Rhinichthys klamathensis goyatoka TaxID=3034132 RepID=UPI0024B6305B|nr:H-2 class II histocompatibility antigen, I-E alpha chain [Rhinichthys klamathensis goyatoka]